MGIREKLGAAKGLDALLGQDNGSLGVEPLAAYALEAGEGLAAQIEASTTVHPDSCGCPGCAEYNGAGSANAYDKFANTDGLDGAPAAPATLQTLANYLTDGYWNDTGRTRHYFNVDDNGTGANFGTLYYNMSGYTGVAGYADDANGLTTARQTLVREAFEFYGEVLGINFIETTSTAGHVDFFFADNRSGANASYVYHAGNGGAVDYSGINIAASWSGSSSNIGGTNGYTYQTVLHEIGHALGLGHQGNYNAGVGTPTYANSAQWQNDSWQQTMMSYWDQVENTSGSTTGVDYAQLIGPMAVDWIALQELYGGQDYVGRDFGVNNAFTGNTIYGVGTNVSSTYVAYYGLAGFADTNAFSIVDGSGIDTIDFSNYNANQQIDLTVASASSTQGTISSVGGLTGNMTLAVGTIIENATGGGGNDTLTGNQYNNTLTGNAGNDTLIGRGGQDRMIGGAGNDIFVYENGEDGINGETADGGVGTDTVRLSGPGVFDLREMDFLSIEEFEFTGSSSSNFLYLGSVEMDSAGEISSTVLIDGYNVAGSNDFVRVYINQGQNTADISGWTFQDWVNTSGGSNQDRITMHGDANNNTLTGSTQYDTLYGEGGNDVLDGFSGNDFLYGSSGNDSLQGGLGDDYLSGGNDNDTLDGGLGNDTILGGNGDDLLIDDGSMTEIDSYDGGAGIDTFRHDRTWVPSVHFNLMAGVASFSGNNYDTFTGIENLEIGGSAQMTGDNNANVLTALAANGNNSIHGMGGDDTINAGGGNDTIDGGDGNDTVNAGDGDDLIIGTDTFTANLNVYDGGAGIDTFRHDDTWVSTVHFNLMTGFSIFNGNNYDSLTNIENLEVGGSAQITGDNNANVLTALAANGNNSIHGMGGDDTINAGGGNDTIDGGDGNDTVNAGDGDDLIIGTDTFTTNLNVYDGGAGIDTFRHDDTWVSTVHFNLMAGFSIFNGNNYDSLTNIENLEVGGSAQITGDNNANVLTALSTTGVNTILGMGGNDVINAGGGNDIIDGGAGDDTVNGEDGDDTLIDNDSGIGDVFNGGAGTDTLIADITWVDAVIYDFNVGTMSYFGTVYDTFSGIENLTTGGGADVIGDANNNIITILDTGGLSSNSIDGGLGNDIIDAGIGNDTLIGGGGLDTVLGGSGDDTVFWRTTTVTYSASGSSYDGGADTDTIDGGETNFGTGATFNLAAGTYDNGGSFIQSWVNFENYFNGNSASGAETVIGTDGDNVLTTGGGNNFIDGGLGNDTISAGGGNDTVIGGDGNDSIDGGIGNDSLLGGKGDDSLIAGDGDDIVKGGKGADILVGDAGADTLEGGSGQDSLSGGAGIDNLLGGGGVDTINGGSEADILNAGGGNDWVIDDDFVNFDVHNGGNGRDTIDYSNVTFVDGLVTIDLIAGQTSVSGGNTEDIISFENVEGSGGGETIIGTNGNNILNGNGGADDISGRNGNDTINGGAGGDTIDGGNGKDVINGGGGVDNILGGNARDTLTGGAGADNFIYTSAVQSGVGGSARDLITDFELGIDEIDVSAIDAAIGVGGNQAFTFIGSGAFTSTAGELRFDQQASRTIVRADRDGDGIADMEWHLDSSLLVTAGDFIL